MFGLLKRRRLSSATAVIDFLSREAAYLAQSALNGYLRAKTQISFYQLSSEPAFIAATEVARWEGFAAITADMLVVLEGQLRVDARDPARLADWLADAYARMLAAHPVPAHRRDTGWADVIAAFRPRLARTQLAAPLTADMVARISAARVFDTLPVHANHRRGDTEAVYGAIRFGMLGTAQRLEAQIDPRAILEDIDANAPRDGS